MTTFFGAERGDGKLHNSLTSQFLNKSVMLCVVRHKEGGFQNSREVSSRGQTGQIFIKFPISVHAVVDHGCGKY